MDLRLTVVKAVTKKAAERVRTKRPMRLVVSIDDQPYLVDPKFFTVQGVVSGQQLLESTQSAAVRLIMAAARERPEEGSFYFRESSKMVTRPTLFVFWFPPSEWSLDWAPHLSGHLVDVREQRLHEEQAQRHSKMAFLDTLYGQVCKDRQAAVRT